MFEEAQFNCRCQNDGESVETFITAVHKLAEHLHFGTLKEELIWDHIVVGIRDRRLSERLQLDPELTLAKAIQTVRHNDIVKCHRDGIIYVLIENLRANGKRGRV